MSPGNFCVAGWDASTGRMVRPLQNGRNWTAGLLQQHGVAPGAVLNFNPTGVAHHSAFPHHTEDTPVDLASIAVVAVAPGAWFGPNAPSCAITVAQAFQGHVQHNSVWNGVLQGVYVPVGTVTRSLWGVSCQRAALIFVEEFDKLKAELDDGTATYKLAVTSHGLKEIFRGGGLAAVNQALPKGGNLHVRVGLARAFGNPADKCYVMINGVRW
ncbi:MAG: dual OB domain-containing protein [Methylocella sp.]